MNRKYAKTVVLLGLAVLSLGTWRVTTAKDRDVREQKRSALPAAVEAAVRKKFPKAAILQVERERESITVYEVKLGQSREDYEVKIAADGTIMEIEKEVAPSDLPDAVTKALAELAEGSQAKRIERAENLAVVKAVRLRRADVVYEVEFIRDGKEVEVKIGEDGTFLGKEIEHEGENSDDGDDDGYERSVSLEQIPAAVRATILREAGNNRVTEIEEKPYGGRKIYEAGWMVDGREVEIKVSPDGKLLGRQIGDNDDDDPWENDD